MKLGKIRAELLAQHEGVRARLDAALRALHRCALGKRPSAELRDELERLGAALRSHHLSEERALRELAQHIEEGTPGRDAMLSSEHVGEHRELCDALCRLGSMPDPVESGRELQRFCERLLAHLTSEEKAFLNAAVLRDDESTPDTGR
jgi:hypothetical protein